MILTKLLSLSLSVLNPLFTRRGDRHGILLEPLNYAKIEEESESPDRSFEEPQNDFTKRLLHPGHERPQW